MTTTVSPTLYDLLKNTSSDSVKPKPLDPSPSLSIPSYGFPGLSKNA